MRKGWAYLFAGLCAGVAALLAFQFMRTPVVPLVASVGARDVLSLIAQGKTVVFVDAREPEEHAEEHIPGAINIPLRDLGTLDPAILGNPDLVIAYCLKDFRGFEVARALNNLGVRNVATLREAGINGWKKLKLPVATAARPDALAVPTLHRCAADPRQCGSAT